VPLSPRRQSDERAQGGLRRLRAVAPAGLSVAVAAGVSEVRIGLAAGGRGIRTSDPTFKRTAVSRARPFVFWRPAAPTAIVLGSENDDFELPASQSNLARRAP
jgi:hypothetical protein